MQIQLGENRNMKNSIILTFLVVIFASCFGCATSKTYNIGVGEARKYSFELIDKRDDKQKQAEIMSLSITNCWYGIYRLGDNQITPSRLTVLSNKLEENLGSKLSGKEIVVKRFEVYNNVQSAMRGSFSSNFATYGLLGAAIIENGCEGGYALKGNPDNLPAVIVNLELIVDKKVIKDKIVQIEPQGKFTSTDDEVVSERVKRAINSAIDKVIKVIAN